MAKLNLLLKLLDAAGALFNPARDETVAGLLTDAQLRASAVAIKGGIVAEVVNTAGALNADVIPSTDVSAFRWISLHLVSGAFSGTITYQGSNNNTDWASVGMMSVGNTQSSGATTSSFTTTANVLTGCPVTFKHFRARITSYTSGSITGTAEFSSAPVTPVSFGAAVTNQTEDAAHASGAGGMFVLGVRNDTEQVLTSADGDYSPVAVDSSGRVLVKNIDLATTALRDALRGAGSRSFTDLYNLLAQQREFSESLFTDNSGANYLRRVTYDESTGTTTVIYTDLTGATVTPGAGLRPLASSDKEIVETLFTSVGSGTGYSVNDVIARIAVVDTSTSPVTLTSTWLNVTTGALIAAPNSAHLDAFLGLTDAELAARMGSATDAEATGDGTLIAITKRIRTLLGNLGASTDAEAAGDGTLIAITKRIRTLFGSLIALFPTSLGAKAGSASLATVGSIAEISAGNSWGNNTTPQAVGIGEVLYGAWIDLRQWDMVTVFTASSNGSAADGLVLEQSVDGSGSGASAPVNDNDAFTIQAGTNGQQQAFGRKLAFGRVKYTHGATAGTVIIQTLLHPRVTQPSTHRMKDAVSGDQDGGLTAAVIARKDFPSVGDAVEVTGAGDTTLRTPASGMRLRLKWIGLSSNPAMGSTTKATVRFGSNSPFYRWWMGAPGAFAHGMVREGGVNEALIINCTSPPTGVTPLLANFDVEEIP